MCTHAAVAVACLFRHALCCCCCCFVFAALALSSARLLSFVSALLFISSPRNVGGGGLRRQAGRRRARFADPGKGVRRHMVRPGQGQSGSCCEAALGRSASVHEATACVKQLCVCSSHCARGRRVGPLEFTWRQDGGANRTRSQHWTARELCALRRDAPETQPQGTRSLVVSLTRLCPASTFECAAGGVLAEFEKSAARRRRSSRLAARHGCGKAHKRDCCFLSARVVSRRRWWRRVRKGRAVAEYSTAQRCTAASVRNGRGRARRGGLQQRPLVVRWHKVLTVRRRRQRRQRRCEVVQAGDTRKE